MIENINPNGYKKIGVYTPAKKIDCGTHYLIYVSGIQAHASKDNNSKVLMILKFKHMKFFQI